MTLKGLRALRAGARPGWVFNPPPGWPAPPPGWRPPKGWQPDPAWPPPPAGWVFWKPEAPPEPPAAGAAPQGGLAGLGPAPHAGPGLGPAPPGVPPGGGFAPPGEAAGVGVAPGGPPEAGDVPSAGGAREDGVPAGRDIHLTFEGQPHVFPPGQLVRIGRASDNHIVVGYPAVSRKHAHLSCGPDGWVFENIGQAPTFLDGESVTRVAVNRAVELTLGSPRGPALHLEPAPPPAPPEPPPRTPTAVAAPSRPTVEVPPPTFAMPGRSPVAGPHAPPVAEPPPAAPLAEPLPPVVGAEPGPAAPAAEPLPPVVGAEPGPPAPLAEPPPAAAEPPPAAPAAEPPPAAPAAEPLPPVIGAGPGPPAGGAASPPAVPVVEPAPPAFGAAGPPGLAAKAPPRAYAPPAAPRYAQQDPAQGFAAQGFAAQTPRSPYVPQPPPPPGYPATAQVPRPSPGGPGGPSGDGGVVEAFRILVPVRSWLHNPGWRQGLRLLVITYALLPLVFIAVFASSGNLSTPGWAYGLYIAPLWAIGFWLLIRPGPVRALEVQVAIGIIIWTVVWINIVTININDHLGRANHAFSFPAALGVGYNEEITKALPVLLAGLILLKFRDAKLDVRMWMFLGTIAGLTFGVSEAALYASREIVIINQAQVASQAVTAVLSFAERVFVDGFQHAVWAGISAFFIGMAVNYRRQRIPLIILGVSLPAFLHALNDWSVGEFRSYWVWIIIQAVSLLLFLGYTMSAASIEQRVRQTPMFRGESLIMEVFREPKDS